MKTIINLVTGCVLATMSWWATAEEKASSDSNILARVGDRIITFPQLNTQLNSTAVVGVSTPTLGTPERRTVMLTLLDRAISVDLLYLDAVNKGLQEDPRYRSAMQTYSNGMLAGLYRKHYFQTASQVSEEELTEYVKQHFSKTIDVDEKTRPLLEAKIRKAKYVALKQGLRKHLHEGVDVNIRSKQLEPIDDAERSDDQVIAKIDDTPLTWGQYKKLLSTLNNRIDIEKRLKTLNGVIENNLLAMRARKAGFDQDPGYQSALTEFSVTSLVNLHRKDLSKRMEPTEQEIRDFYAEYQQQIAFNEHRKLQMVVLEDEAKAQRIFEQLEQGELTLYQAAIEHSIDPRAKESLGDFGWVEAGSGFPDLDELVFALEIGELGGPVETPAGWHIVRATEQRASRYTDIDDAETQLQTRRLLLKQRLDDYVVRLRKTTDSVVVYEENLNRLLLKEAQWIAAKSREMENNPERARIILEEMRALVE